MTAVLTAPRSSRALNAKPEEYLVCWFPTPTNVVRVHRAPTIDIRYIGNPPPGASAAVFAPHKGITEMLSEVFAGFFGIHEHHPHFYFDGELLTLQQLEKMHKAEWYREQLARGHNFRPYVNDPIAIRVNGSIQPFYADDVFVPSLKH